MVFKLVTLLIVSISVLAADRGKSPHELKYLDTPDLAISALYDSIKNAKESIDMTYYLMAPCDSVTKVLMNAIGEKKRENPNFKARIIVDAYNYKGSQKSEFAAFLKNKNIELKYFNDAPLIPALNNYRTHAKFSVVDGGGSQPVLITGGRNMADEYYGMKENEVNWIDRDVIAKGAAGYKAKVAFSEVWNSSYASIPSPADAATLKEAQKSCFAWGPKERKLKNFLDKRSKPLLSELQKHSCDDVKFYTDSMNHSNINITWEGPDKLNFDKVDEERRKAKPTATEITNLLEPAKSISMENYSYIPHGKMESILAAKRKQGIPVHVYTNHFTKGTDDVEVEHNYASAQDTGKSQKNFAISRLAQANQRWELSPPNTEYSIHSKIYVTDSKNVAVSSFNLDPRSYHTNPESALIVKNCPTFAKQVQETSQLLLRSLPEQEKKEVELRCEGQYEDSLGLMIQRTIRAPFRDLF